jgi:FecR protein
MSKPKLPRLLILTPLVLSLFALPCWADSQARVVRLSDVQGDVRIDRNTGGGYEKAFLNLPITQGMKVRTLDDGRAALELEDGSTVRLTPNTILEVPRLSLSDAGTKLSGFRLLDGTAYINFLGAKDAEVDFTFAREKLVLTSATHLRVDMADTDAVVAVFKGDVEIAGPEGTVQVAKNHKASFDLIEDKYKVARNLDDAPYDAWDKQQDQYQQRYSDNSYSQYSPYAYGTSDLNYYGSFFNAPGYGMLWQPYFVGAGWDPFMNGAWAFYPGVGYGWVSAYPWGWTPCPWVWVGLATGRSVDGMEHDAGHLERAGWLSSAANPGAPGQTNLPGEQRTRADHDRKIKSANSSELCRLGHSARKHSEPGRAFTHRRAARDRHHQTACNQRPWLKLGARWI